MVLSLSVNVPLLYATTAVVPAELPEMVPPVIVAVTRAEDAAAAAGLAELP